MWNNCKLKQNFFHIFFCNFSRIFGGFQNSSGYEEGKEVRKENLTRRNVSSMMRMCLAKSGAKQPTEENEERKQKVVARKEESERG